MALLLFTGFNESQALGDLTDLMFVATFSAEGGNQTTGGRFGRCLSSNEADNQHPVFGPPALSMSGNTFILGGVFKYTTATATNNYFLGLGRAVIGTALGPQVGLRWNFTNASAPVLEVLRDTTVIGQSAPLAGSLVSATDWHTIEVKFVVDPAVGSCRVLLDGNEIINLTNVNTQAQVDSLCNIATVFGKVATTPTLPYATLGTSSTVLCDTYWIMDMAGTNPLTKDFISQYGAPRVYTVFPNADGALSNWVGSDLDQVNNYLLVDETSPNDNTDYVKASAAGTIDTYTYPDFNYSPDRIVGVSVTANAIKDDTTERKLAGAARLASVNYATPGQSLRQTTYRYHKLLFELNPSNNLEWDISAFNGAEFGVKVDS